MPPPHILELWSVLEVAAKGWQILSKQWNKEKELTQTQGRKHCCTKKWSHCFSHKRNIFSLCRSDHLAFRNSDGIALFEITTMGKKASKSFDIHCWSSALSSAGWFTLHWLLYPPKLKGGVHASGHSYQGKHGQNSVHQCGWLQLLKWKQCFASKQCELHISAIAFGETPQNSEPPPFLPGWDAPCGTSIQAFRMRQEDCDLGKTVHMDKVFVFFLSVENRSHKYVCRSGLTDRSVRAWSSPGFSCQSVRGICSEAEVCFCFHSHQFLSQSQPDWLL